MSHNVDQITRSEVDSRPKDELMSLDPPPLRSCIRIRTYGSSCDRPTLPHSLPSCSPLAGLKRNAMIASANSARNPSTSQTQSNPPVRFVIAVTSSGPVSEHVRSVRANREKKVDSCPYMHH